ncbi:Receptor-type tyrosine-protein phosphatase S [Acropora cervicornis]|uniref:Receptor-type tyrosine-protein phosphatase S n=1 Tax=Acropora cervicornis TaxID=6130 RepID=A0AAD9QH61_ACRCE|nr:Receptor-type tyrosine-protein phosphatase S [Acropora cervicornis]
MSFRSEVVFGKNHLLLKILAFVFVVCQDKQAVSGSQEGPNSSWPFDDLNANNTITHGNVEKTISPVGDGIYLDDSSESFVEIKNYNERCMGNPSTCDITMGFFFKHTTHKNRVTYFGNKGNNDDLYRGINMHCKQEEHYKCYISVYGEARYCHCRIYLLYGVWQYIGLIWEKAGSLTLYHESSIVEAYKSNRCTCNKTGQLKTGKYYLGKDTFPNAYFKDLDICGGYTEITLKIDFWELAYNASKVSGWEKAFNDTINELYQNGKDFMEIKNTSISNSGGNVSVTFTMKFTQVWITWKSMLLLNLALENRTILGSYGVPKNHAPTGLHHNRIRIAMDSVETAVHEGYLYCYRVLYKKLDDPDTSWNARCHRRNPPAHPWIEPGGPPQSFVAYNTSISSLHAQWEEVEESKHNGIMLGFKVRLLKFVDSRFQQVQSQTLHWNVLQTNFTGLYPFTKFKIEVRGFNAIGDGPVAAAEPPDNFKVVHQGSTKLRASWNKVPQCCQLGIIRGYHVTLTDPSNASVHETRTTENLIQTFTNLKKFHLYNVSVVAFTSKGVGPMNFKLVSTDQDDAAPEIVSAYNLSQTEIFVSWTPIPTDKENGIILQHKASFSAINGAHSGYKSFEANTSQGVIDGLYPFKEYAIHLSVSTITGFGPISEVVHVTTEEAPPGLPPSKFHGVNSSSTSIFLSWDAIPPSQVAGILTSFYISYRQINTNDNTTYEIAVPITNLTYEITNLRKYTNYSLEIKGATKFPGINTQPIIISTDEDVPSLPPQNIEAQNSSSTKIFVQWNPIPTDFIHGILLGFKLLYRAASRDNSMVFSSQHATFGVFPSVTQWCLFNECNMEPSPRWFCARHFTRVSYIYLENSGSGELVLLADSRNNLRAQRSRNATCKCPSVFKTTWYHFPPYISFDNGSVGGFIPQILELAVQKCCSDCKGPDGKSISIVDFELDGKGNKARKPGVNDFMSSIDSDTDLGVPLNGYKDQTHYSLYRYVKLAESPGVAFMTVMDKSDKAATIANMFLQAWPLLLVLLFMTLLAGVIMSFIEIGEGDLPKSYVHGAWEGFWWAFVTASTVGYGDRCASGVASRLFSIVWTLSGLIVLVILIGSIATTLTHFGHVGPYVTLYVRDYLTYEKISEALANLEVKGVLVDLYVLSTHKHLFGDPRFRIVRVYDYKTSYGAVMAGQAMKLQHCFTKEIKENAADAFKSIDENVKILKR